MSSDTFKQEMPPLGGYRPVNFERVLPKKFLTFGKCFTVVVTTPVIWLYFYRKDKRYRYVKDMENRDMYIPIEPCLTAERDRAYLTQLRRNREDERDLMKNVPYWEVGKLYNINVFKTVPEDILIDPDVNEYYAHTRYAFFTEYFHFEHTR